MKQCCSVCFNAIDEGENPVCGQLIYCTAKMAFVSGRKVTKPNKCLFFNADSSKELEAMAKELEEDTITENQISLF